MTQKDYRRMLIESVFQPLFVNMVVEGMIEEFELSEEDDDTSVSIKLKMIRPDELEDITVEEVEEARKEEEKLRD